MTVFRKPKDLRDLARTIGEVLTALIVFSLFFVVFGVVLSIVAGQLLSEFGYAFSWIIPLLLSLWITYRIMRHIDNVSRTNASGDQPKSGQKAKSALFATLVVIAGLVTGFIIGVGINFGACYKSECSGFEATAPITLPAASLLFTIPVSRKMFRSSKQQPTNEAGSPAQQFNHNPGPTSTQENPAVQPNNANPQTSTDSTPDEPKVDKIH